MSKFGIGTHRTAISNENGSTVVTYHATQVVSFNDKLINLRSGGYQTVTTKRRMNEASVTFGLDYQVFQIDFSWFVSFRGKNYTFHDKMTLDRQTGRVYDIYGMEHHPVKLS